MGRYRNWIFLGILCLCIIGTVIVLNIYWTTTTVVVVRHADRDGNRDALTDAGRARAANLRDILPTTGGTKIYATNTTRTKDTAQPLADAVGREVVLYSYNPADDNNAEIPGDPIADARAGRGGTLVIVAHSGDAAIPNTVAQIVRDLGGGDVTVGETEFDNLFVLTVSRWGGASLIKATYGEPRFCPTPPPCPKCE